MGDVVEGTNNIPQRLSAVVFCNPSCTYDTVSYVNDIHTYIVEDCLLSKLLRLRRNIAYSI